MKNGSTDLTASGSYTQATTPAATSDVTFTSGTVYSPAAFTVNSNLAIGTLNDLSSTPISISNSAGTVTTLTLSGGTDTVLGSVTGDLLYVAAGSSLTLQNGTGTLNLALGASGNFDVGGTAGVSSAVSGAFAITKTNAGTLTLSGANTYTGNTTLSGGGLVLDFTSDNSSKLSTGTGAAGLSLGGGVLTMTGNVSGASSQTVSGTTINGGTAVVVNNNGGPGATLNLGAVTRTFGGAVDFSGTGTINTNTPNPTFTGGTSPGTILGGYATFGNGSTFATSAGTAGTAGPIAGLATGSYSTSFTAATDVDAPIGASAPTAALTINSLRFNNAGAYTVNPAGALTVASGGILETSLVGNNAVTVGTGGPLTSGNGTDLIVHQYNNANTMTISSVISGTIGLTKDGPGTLILSGVNTFSGAISISGGTLSAAVSQLNNATANSPLGSNVAHPVTINNGASFQLTGNNTLNPQAGTTTFTIGSGGGTFDVVGTGTIVLDDAGQFISNGPFTKTGTGQLTLGNGTAYVVTNTVNVAQGSLKLLNNGTSALGTATLVSVASGAELDIDGLTANRPLVLAGTGRSTSVHGALTNSSTTAAIYNGNVSLAAATSIGGAGTGGITIGGVVSGTGPLTKLDTSALTLSGANTYSGGTIVSAGTLKLNNTTGSAVGPGNVTLNATGGTTLSSGTAGSMTGAVTAATSGTNSVIAPGGVFTPGGSTATIGTLNVGGLALTSNATTLAFDVASAASSDLLNVNGLDTFTITGLSPVPVALGQLPTVAGVYHLIAFNQDNAGTVSLSNFATQSGSSGRVSYSFSLDAGTGNQKFLDLNVTTTGSATITANFVGTSTPTSWNTSANWSTNPVVPGQPGDTVTFNNGTSTPTQIQVNLDGRQSVGSLTFNNTGTTSFNIAPGSNLNLAPTLVFDNLASGATLTNSSNNNTISAPVVLNSATSVSVTGTTAGSPNVLTLSGGLTGTVGLTLAASTTGVLTLSGTNSAFSGAITVSAGTLRAGSATAFGTGATTVASGATADLNGQALTSGSFTLNGTGVSGAGALTNSGGAAASTTGTVALASATTIGGANAITLSGVVSGSGAFTKAGIGNLTLSNNANTDTGVVVVNGGTLTLTGANGGTGTIQAPSITVNAGATLVLTNADTLGFNVASRDTLTINGGSVLNNGSATRDTISNGITMTGGILGGTSAGGAATSAGAYSFNSNAGITATSDAAGNAAVVSAPISYQGGTLPLAVSHTGTAVSDLTITAPIVNYNGTTSPTGITKTGLGVLTLSSANTYTNPTLLNGGTTITNNAAVFNATAITVGTGVAPTSTPTVTGNATLLVRGNTTVGAATGGSLTVTGGDATTTGQGTLSLVDGTINSLTFANLTTAATSFSIGSATSPGVVSLEIGTASGSNDKIVLPANDKFVVGAGGATVNIVPTGALVNGTYNLVTFTAGNESGTGSFLFSNGTTTETLNGATLTLSSPSAAGATAETLTISGAAGGAVPATAYFNGANDNNWSTLSGTGSSNFTSDVGGTTNTGQIPGAATDVYIASSNATNFASTVLGSNFIINSLTIGTGSAAGTAILIGGANTLTINALADSNATPTYSSGNPAGNAINVLAGAGPVTISAPLVLGGAQTWTNNSTSLLTISGPSLNGITFALTVTGSGDTAVSAPITGTGLLTKSGTGTLTLSGGNGNTAGGTTILGGTVLSGIDNALSSGPLTIGAVNTSGTASLNLSTFNQTVSSLSVLSNSSTANTIAVGSGKTLTLTNGLTIGYDATSFTPLAATTTKLAVTGAGGLSITGGTVNLGVSQATANAANASTGTLDLTAMTGAFTANVTAFNVGGGSGTSGVANGGNDDAGVLNLGSGPNTIITPLLTVGNSNQNNVAGNSSITLGTGTNALRADTINIALSKASATVGFASQTAGSSGTVTITNAAGTGAAVINVGNQTSTGTSTAITGTLELRGHLSTVNAAAVTVGNNNNLGNVGSASGVINFDTGSFNATSLALGLKSNTGTASNTATLGLGGGTFAVSGATTFAGHTGTATTASNVTGTLNVSAGTFTTGSLVGATKNGTGLGVAIGNINVSGTGAVVVGTGGFSLATQATAGTATGTLSITGGSVTSNSDILDGGGATTTTITLNGGLLDLTGHNIGNAANPIDALNFQTGTLQNVAQINNGAALNKTAGATLLLAGSNAYTGPTNISAGTYLVTGTHGTGSTLAGAYSISSPATLGGTGTINLASTAGITVASGATLAPGGANNTIGTLTVNAVVGTGTPAVALASGSNFNIVLSHTAADELIVNNGAINLGGATLNLFQDGSLQANEHFVIVDPTGPTSINGTFANPSSGVSNGIGYTLTYNPSTVTLDVTSVPEPASLGVLGLAGFGLLARRRRRIA